MSAWRYILASLWHHRRVQLAVAAGVAVATAVITGALLVGDSVRGSLRELTLERLGRIEAMVIAAQPFRAALGKELAARSALTVPSDVVPLILTQGTLKSTGTESRLATGVSVVGYSDHFWRLGRGGPDVPLAENWMALTAALAEELGARVGDELLLRLPAAGTLPGDSTLGDKEGATVSRRFTLIAILPSEGLERFSLRPTQQRPRNVFLRIGVLQDLLDWPGQANALAVAPRDDFAENSSQAYWDDLQKIPLDPTLADLGLVATTVLASATSQPLAAQITSKAMVLPNKVVEVVNKTYAAAKPQAVVTYLANTIEVGGRKIPYSTITGVRSEATVGPLLDEAGQPIEIADEEIVLNDWAANDLEAEIGDEVTVTYYEPETTHGKLRVATPLKLRLKAIVPLASADGQPTAAADPTLTPELPGVTDQRSIADWDLPFELVETVRRQDEDYWEEHRTTPKAFVSLALAERLWQTRWGTVSALRLPAVPVAEVERQLPAALDPADLGMIWLPVKLQGLQAAHGTTSFEGLFIGFSFFLMASAVLLVALLFRLNIEGRAAEVGTLAAIGFGVGKLRRLLLGEAAIVAIIGAAVGVAAGIGYAKLMIHGLSTWWVAAMVTPFLKLHIVPRSLAIGFAIGLVVALLTTAWSLRKTVRLPARQLLAGDATPPGDRFGAQPKLGWLPAAPIIAALVLAAFAIKLEGEAQAGAFFGSGALVLTALLWRLGQQLRAPARVVPGSLSLTGLSARNARRNPSRTILSVSLAAVASFLIVALSAFRITPTNEGTGGFDLVATSDQPIHYDLGTMSGREELGFTDAENEQLADLQVVSLRVRDGEDASCLNLYQTAQPRILGVPEPRIAVGNFGVIPAQLKIEEFWGRLGTDLGKDDAGRPVVPIVLDKNTAVYSLHLAGIGSRMTVRDAQNENVTLEVIGLLGGSVLQGDVIISEANFLRLFPDEAGYRMFLVKAGRDPAGELSPLLESRLEDFGFDAVPATQRLAEFMAVQNTYLSTFQSLGGLGLLLGTFGLAVAQLRSVLERRGELALLRSAGFSARRLAKLVLGENIVLLASGLGIGSLAALAAVLPHWWLGEADIPWATLATMLLAVAVAGVVAGGMAVRAAVRAPLLPALRGD